MFCGCPDKGKLFEIQLDRAGARAFTNHYINEKILHCRIQDFFDDRVYPVDFIDKQDVAPFQRGEEGGNIPRLFQYRAGCRTDISTHFTGDDMSKRRLTKSRRPGEQDVVERFAAFLCCLDRNVQGVFYLYLPDKFIQTRRADGQVIPFLREWFRRDNPLGHGPFTCPSFLQVRP